MYKNKLSLRNFFRSLYPTQMCKARLRIELESARECTLHMRTSTFMISFPRWPEGREKILHLPGDRVTFLWLKCLSYFGSNESFIFRTSVPWSLDLIEDLKGERTLYSQAIENAISVNGKSRAGFTPKGERHQWLPARKSCWRSLFWEILGKNSLQSNVNIELMSEC